MCILFIAVKQHPDYPLIVCANRDEFHQRPTEKMHYWPNDKIYAGKDLTAGGTWFGVNKQGEFAALTNYRTPSTFDANKTSRGELVVNALKSSSTTFFQQLRDTSEQYNSFNLVKGNEHGLSCFDSTTKQLHVFSTGIFSISNGAINDIWPKMQRGCDALEKNIMPSDKGETSQKALNIEKLFTLMKDQQPANKEQLPNTGVAPELEHLLSSIFIVSPNYGTRSTTIFIKDNVGKCQLVEQSYNSTGDNSTKVSLTLE